ncbi:MAG: phosphoserine phosphatase [Omnitrophica bacterium RIFCSPLOWO2_12_FULL_44_17]|uniref:phosphoserine phosphatase n=1 Tax=Candidatus Danuiimicrobium aquiferis TaxID=1801832 RepID=A0A1G1KVS7_9BACT|nr:MAG: phosphoserine phosphatase [Omnitrophica bacterium RIFCSPHIGHO2_02_FULL_45_28]OGW88702.1 MAG: phosphoserine phosphatase [Omnitrophica bacterium RIFCSPHIGHO2_12_FULL_44_12]OGW96882.1 MAG: phosphoserine phosphatase [Omnitrophica bacterium RIFCSPLOWO2_12_FULL_44_17]OGX02415.1 MAG: phosphoserine phosphatase [Omnitrophica bacterium RIFCSPLOWO2_02_FULL_44_11]
MMICCLDLEGVLVPEIWIQVARKTKIKALERTTRDEPDYDKLMRYRLEILKANGIKLKDIQHVISKIQPLPGAKEFLKRLQAKHQVIILSDTYYEFAGALLTKLGFPTLFCNWLSVDKRGFISDYHLRQKSGKEKAVRGLKKLGFEIYAAGDSYNDIAMLKVADKGILFNPPEKIIKQFPEFRVTRNYTELLKALE